MARGTAAERSHFLRFSRAEKMDILVTGNTVLIQALEYKILDRNLLRLLDVAILALEFSMLSSKRVLCNSVIKILDLPFLLSVALCAISAREPGPEFARVLVLVTGKALIFFHARPLVLYGFSLWRVTLGTL